MLSSPWLLLEDKRLEILGPFRGDTDLCTAVWIPSIKTPVATDTVFNPVFQTWLRYLSGIQRTNPQG